MFAEGIYVMWSRSAHPISADANIFASGLFVALGLYWIFLWLSGDQQQNGYRRSVMMNIGIAALGIVFLPVYLYRSRAPGQKAKAIGLFFLSCIGCYLITVAGVVAGMLMFGHYKL